MHSDMSLLRHSEQKRPQTDRYRLESTSRRRGKLPLDEKNQSGCRDLLPAVAGVGIVAENSARGLQALQ